MTKYTHLKLNEDYPVGIAGYYVPEKEARLKYNGREVLYVVGQAVVESSCYSDSCSPVRKVYAIVPGYIVNWQNSKNEDGLPSDDCYSKAKYHGAATSGPSYTVWTLPKPSL